jgi:hypothetical protein
MSLVTLAHPDGTIVVERGVLELHSPIFKEMLAECTGGGDATVPLVDDTLAGAKAFVMLCKIGVGEDATELNSITPRLLADALPFVHKYAAVGLGKFAREWFGHIVETFGHKWFGTNKFGTSKAGTNDKHLDDLSECFAILDNLFQAEWTPADIQWITGNTLGYTDWCDPDGYTRGQPHGDHKVLESLTQRTLTKMMIEMNKHYAPKDQPGFCVRKGARNFPPTQLRYTDD